MTVHSMPAVQPPRFLEEIVFYRINEFCCNNISVINTAVLSVIVLNSKLLCLNVGATQMFFW